eukprot:6862296-Prorocentrum_lima.AAC.1
MPGLLSSSVTAGRLLARALPERAFAFGVEGEAPAAAPPVPAPTTGPARPNQVLCRGSIR